MDWLVGDGRGDWILDIYGDYAVAKINSYCICLVYREKQEGGWEHRSFVVPNYFIKAYQVHEPYICLEGIITKSEFISADELKRGELSYYLVDASSGDVIGPYDSYEEYVEHCGDLEIEITDEWLTPHNPNE